MGNATIYEESDASLEPIKDKTIAILGYGNQGRAQARNLRDSGVSEIIVGNKRDSSWDRAKQDGFNVYQISEAAKQGDILFLLVPDEAQPDVYNESIKPHLSQGDVLNFASGYNITYEFIDPPNNVDVTLVAPRMVGKMVRELYESGDGAPAFVAVEQDASGKAMEVVLALAHGIGATRSAAIEIEFDTETILDLMTEQALVPLIFHALRTKYLVERSVGIPPEAILLEEYVSRELSEIFEKAATDGFMQQLPLHSKTSQYGQLTGFQEYSPDQMKKFMEQKLQDIQSGAFAKEWSLERQSGYPEFNRLYKKYSESEMMKKEQELINVLNIE